MRQTPQLFAHSHTQKILRRRPQNQLYFEVLTGDPHQGNEQSDL